MYDNKHKTFLHHILKNGVLPLGKALLFCRSIKAEVTDLESLKTFTSEINKELSKQEFKIVLSVCEITGEDQVILINTANDDISKLQNSFSHVELEYFQALIQEIVTGAGKKLPQIMCLNVSSTLTDNLLRSDAEKLINKWVRMGYLIIHNNEVYLGARCIIEFTTYFHTYCKDYICTCGLCSELVFAGKSCSSCKKIMHSYCLQKFLDKHNSCPECKNKWNENTTDVTNKPQNEDTSSEQEDDDDDECGPTKSKRRR